MNKRDVGHFFALDSELDSQLDDLGDAEAEDADSGEHHEEGRRQHTSIDRWRRRCTWRRAERWRRRI